MFITEKMHKAVVLLPKDEETSFWDKLGRFGEFQPKTLREALELRDYVSFDDLTDLGNSLREAASFLGVDLSEPLTSASIQPLPPAELAPEAEKIREEVASFREQFQSLREREKRIQRELERLERWRAHLELLKPLEVDVGALKRLRRFEVVAGTLPLEKLPRLEQSLAHIPHALIPYRKERQRMQLVAVALKSDGPRLHKILESALFKEIEIPGLRGTPSEAEQAVEKTERELKAELEKIGQELDNLEQERKKRRRELADFLKVNLATLDALTRTGKTKEIAVIMGWVPKKAARRLEKLVAEEENWFLVSEEVPYHQIQDEYGFKVPSKLRNPLLIRAFESLVEVYGVPRYGRFDPTVVFSLLFLLLFGMMFGDLGHGFIVALAGLFLSFWPRLSRPSWRKTGVIMTAAGASSMLFGTLYGSLFGYEDILPAIWLRPLADVDKLLFYAIMIGVGVILAGIIANIVSKAIGHDWWELAIERSGALGLWFYLGSLKVVWGFSRGEPANLLQVLLLMFLPLLLMLAGELVRKEPPKKGASQETGFTKLIIASVDLFETMLVYLSNSLSFVRVAAFALTHVALSIATFQLAALMRGFPLGNVGYLLVVAGGNILILVLEGGIVAIQTLRLEFYEFFSKFFSEEGVKFNPFKFQFSAKRR